MTITLNGRMEGPPRSFSDINKKSIWRNKNSWLIMLTVVTHLILLVLVCWNIYLHMSLREVHQYKLMRLNVTNFTEDQDLDSNATEVNEVVPKVKVKLRHLVKRSYSQPQNEISRLEDKDDDFDFCGGAMYVRWGRRSCPLETDTEVVYEGVVGGTYAASSGGGVDYLCLPRDPQWNRFTEAQVTIQAEAPTASTTPTPTTASRKSRRGKNKRGKPTPAPTSSTGSDNINLLNRLWQGSRDQNSYIYGAEFTGTEPLFRRDNLRADTFINQDVLCAVCRSNIHVSSLMIPGKRECSPGWTKEYEGYLMSGRVGARAQHRFVCVDSAPEVDFKGQRRDGGAVFHHVLAMCGSLPCPNFVQGRELTCVVCTR